MAGDETRARAVLAEMQARLAQGAHAALGVHGTANPAEARSAFLQLTKTYHPTRFARMSPELQRLSNEVFLALRSAHDSIAKAQPKPRANGSGMLPSSTPPNPIRAAAAPRAGSPPLAGRTTTGVVPTAKRTEQSGAVRSSNDASGIRPARMASPSPPPQEGSEVRSPARAPTPAGGIRVTSKPPVAPRTKSEEHELSSIVDMLKQQQWDAARASLNTLAARQPASTRIRALQSYARGREAQLDRRLDEARVELQEALQLDPDLELAKTALGELFTRRK